ncbi:MAG: hypothetical protein H0T47_09245 [Planctomycetaceae bacterium]|nr:hypothetical protein [Planctomycetaceae bacterium]
MENLRARLDSLERENDEFRRRLDADSESPSDSKPTLPPTGTYWYEPQDGGSQEKDDALDMKASWHNGVEIESKDKKFRLHVGGRIQTDAVFWDDAEAFRGAGGAGDEDSVLMRRARFRIDGTMYEWIDWAAEFDFVNSANFNQNFESTNDRNVINVPAPTDLWVNFKDVPVVGNVRVGNFKESFGMEHLTSSRYLPFLERSFNQDAFYGPFNNGFSPGIALWDTYNDERGTWTTGLFKDLANPFGYDVGDGGYAWTSRLTYLLWYDEATEGSSLFHVGLSNSLRDPADDRLRYRIRPSLRNGPGPYNPALLDTSRFPADTVDYVGAEAAWNFGSLTVQTEYTGGFLSDVTGVQGAYARRPIGSEYVQGGYVQALYFLTGEHMRYDRKSGAFGRVIPDENASASRLFMSGAWQVGVRYSHLDLASSEALDGGVLDDWTFGLNWYLNPNMKVQANYVLAHRDVPPARGESGSLNGFGMRLAYDF